MTCLVVGSVALDNICTPEGSRENAVGGSASYFSLTASRFTDVNMVAVVGEDFPCETIELFRECGINTDGLHIATGKTFSWGGRYHSNMKERDTLYTHLNVFETFDPVLPKKYRRSDFVFLGNIHPSLQLKVLDQMDCKAVVGLDSMNLWIDRAKDKLMEVICRVDILMINDEEILQLTGCSDLTEGARLLMEEGPEYIVAKKGKYGAELHCCDNTFHFKICPENRLVDPTGAGDTFAGGFMGYLSQCGKPE